MKLKSLVLAAILALPLSSMGVSDKVPESQVDSKELNCLALNIYHEARGESEEGQVAVAAVTMNRTLLRGFPETVCGVVYQARRLTEWSKPKFCQFSWVCQFQKQVMDLSSWRKAQNIAYNYLDNQYEDPTKGAAYYHAKYVQPGWRLPFKTSIGNHKFYGTRSRTSKSNI